ncbi:MULTISPECIES: ABC transporter substrate-binding protein [unclassified Caballeronia]|uniref:ABC transporter substrate-binding protein n=1 Tax=unclassified Caballeronia TaxID=2646786 RepID=UPI0028596DDB|nr:MULTISPECIES: ABC transporter substrate-binding protein [unclassified Caballeronia]MDR5814126.1 ABC transporter substrate-binding protein [Caballeronia sp. LZ033]MDR5825595.1 ABC transporter substrate-binding protein [Caballeronia sp. LZ043]MDR5878672.1 ABC transporter substrate-binding protein [Caballeronia sp. LZ032]
MSRMRIACFTMLTVMGGFASPNLVRAEGTIPIAGSFDLSGAAADVGRDVLNGTQYAVKVVNDRGGVLGQKLDLRYQDNGTNPQRAVDQATSLVRDGAKFLTSPQSSASAIAVSKAVAARFKVPMCANSANSDDITIKDFHPYVFQIGASSYMEARALAARLAKKPYVRYAVVSADYAGGRSGANRFKQSIKELNPKAEIVVEEYPKFGATDYSASLNKILAAKPDYVWTFLFGSDLITFTKQARALGFFKQIDNKFMALYDGNTLKALGADAAVGTEGFQRAPANLLLTSSPESKAYIEGYKKVYGSYPSDWTTLAYDCVMTWAQAATRAKSIEPADVIKTLDDGEFQSVRGAFRIGKFDHQAEVPIYIGTVAQDPAFGQPVLNITDIIPGQTVRPTEEALRSMRGK